MKIEQGMTRGPLPCSVISAKSQGKKLGRPHSLGVNQIKLVEQRLVKGETVAALAREFGTSRQSIMRIRQASISVSI